MAGKITAAPQQQGLLQGAFELPVALLGIAVLMATAGVDRLPLHPVVPQQRLITLRERLTFLARWNRRREPIGAVQLRHAAQLPQGILQTVAETLQTLGETDRARFPVGIGQHKVKDQMRERHPGDRDLQTAAVCEVRSTQPTRFVHLREEDFLGRPRYRPPLLQPTLQGAQLTVGEAAGEPPLQVRKQGLGLQSRVEPQLLFQLGPDLGEGINTRTPGAVHAFDLAGEFTEPPVLPRGLGIHAGLGRRLLLEPTVQIKATQATHLLIGDHPKPP